MYTAHLDYFRTQQKELHRQAAEYRLARSLSKPSSWASGIYEAVGQVLIISGQQLIKGSQLSG